MKPLMIALLLTAAAFAQAVVPPVPPAPPACLSGPVTSGTVTLSCTLLDTAQENAESGVSLQVLGFPIFQVRLSSSDPDVIGFRVGVTFVNAGSVLAGTPVSYTTWGTVGRSAATYQAPTPASPYYRYTFALSGTNITSIQVQELKVSSSQSF